MRLVLCDDNRILGDALAVSLQACGHQIVAITTSVAAGIAAVGEHQSDACLMNLRFSSGENGLAAVRTIRLRYPGTAVVILSGPSDPAEAEEARSLGVAGFLGKDQNVGQIARALDQVACGRRVFGPNLSSHRGTAASRRAHPQYELTPREREVLRRIVAGQSTGQMATEMNIAASTLRTYVKNLLTKLGTHSRLQAAALARREGLLAELSSA